MCRLQKKYNPDDTISAVELNARLGKFRIMETDHPDFFFDKLAETNIVYGYQLDKARQISEIMAKSPKIYTNTSVYTESLIVVSKEVLTLDHLQSALNNYWRIEHEDDFDSDSESEDGDEKAEIMSALIEAGKYNNRSKEFFKCGKMGHFVRECRSGGGNINKNNRYQRPENDKGKRKVS